MQPSVNYQHLLDKYLTNSISPEEQRQLTDWLQQDGRQETLEQAVQAALEAEYGNGNALLQKKLFSRLEQDLLQPAAYPAIHRVHLLKRSWFRYAAAILPALCLGAYLLLSHREAGKELAGVHQPGSTDILPGTAKAVLTLADGSFVELDSVTNGALAQQGAIQILKLADGQLSYESGETPCDTCRDRSRPVLFTKNTAVKLGYNTISTPRGGQYQVILPDGSKVWLNAASSLRFPVAFTDAERRVEIQGEAYFEIKANKAMPFTVVAHGTEIQVLGTSFNVNAYSDEASLNTTLVEGKVKITDGTASELLQPGQQARVDINNHVITLQQQADLPQELAWKEGYFRFSKADLPAVMRQISRWYNVDIEYRGKTKQRGFVGEISRQMSLEKVLRILELSDVHFVVEGRKIIVST